MSSSPDVYGVIPALGGSGGSIALQRCLMQGYMNRKEPTDAEADCRKMFQRDEQMGADPTEPQLDPTNKACPGNNDPVITDDGRVFASECEARRTGASKFRKLTPSEYQDWLVYATRGPDMPGHRHRDWSPSPVGGKRESFEAGVKSVFEGYSPRLTGFYVPNPLNVKLARTGGGFPFATKSAEKVFTAAQEVFRNSPDYPEDVLKRKAMDRANVQVSELTPEDEAILDVAINFITTGRDDRVIQPPIVRTGAGEVGKSFGSFQPRGYK